MDRESIIAGVAALETHAEYEAWKQTVIDMVQDASRAFLSRYPGVVGRIFLAPCQDDPLLQAMDFSDIHVDKDGNTHVTYQGVTKTVPFAAGRKIEIRFRDVPENK